MDKYSKTLLIVVLLSVITSFGFMYHRYIIEKNFEVFQNKDEVPELEIE